MDAPCLSHRASALMSDTVNTLDEDLKKEKERNDRIGTFNYVKLSNM